MTPTVIVHQHATANRHPQPWMGKPHSARIHQLMPMSAKAAHPTNAASPWAVITSYHRFGDILSRLAWLWRSRTPSRPPAPSRIVDVTR